MEVEESISCCRLPVEGEDESGGRVTCCRWWTGFGAAAGGAMTQVLQSSAGVKDIEGRRRRQHRRRPDAGGRRGESARDGCVG